VVGADAAASCVTRALRGSRVADAGRPPKDPVRTAEAPLPADAALAAEGVEERPQWSSLWQAPTIVLSVILIGMAVYIALQRAPQDDFDAALDEVERLMAVGELDEAGRRLAEVIEPRLDRTTVLQRARFQACAADWISSVQSAQRVDLDRNNTRVHEHYTEAVSLGLVLDAPRAERWAHALLSLGRLAEARWRLNELDRMDFGDGRPDDVRARRLRTFRRYIELASAEPEGREDVLRMLNDHRADPRTPLRERMWTMARQAEIRLDAGHVQRAVDQLLVDLRLVEYEVGSQATAAAPVLGELLVLLGRGYAVLGEERHARFHIERAMTQLQAADPLRGKALVLLGQIAMGPGDLETALECFDLAVREFAATPAHLPALLGRAEVRGLLGEHEASQADYRLIVESLAHGARPPYLAGPTRIAASIIDRHDAMLTQGDLEAALEYATIAEAIFARARTPTDVLIRLATTSRQLADNLVRAAAAGIDHAEPEAVLIDPAVRYDANRYYERAADYFIRHARAVAALPGDDGWAESLFHGAESYDLAGLHEAAIRHLEEYLAGRSVEDPRRPEVRFRLARCHHALQQYESAVMHYERLIAEHPRSAVATRSHVPLARVYFALGRRSEAEQQLRQVLMGALPIQPDALDYREALFELGAMQYNLGNYAAAVQPLDEALQRYSDDPRINEVRFRLADSYRNTAMEMSERLRESAADLPGERRRLEAARRVDLQRAQELFAVVVSDYEGRPPASLSVLQIDLLRGAQIHLADCAFHLGQYELAVQLYDHAARAWTGHHLSMHALVQIVNAYVQMGDDDRAGAAHQRALMRLHQLRDEAFNQPDVLMDRRAWERWLENSPVQPLHAAAGASEHP
jgi:tetratricopeptide (TPR) repeat protein